MAARECAKRYYRERYRALVNAGVCTRCHRDKAVPGKTLCESCLCGQAAAMTGRRRERIEAKMCVTCGARPAVEGHTRCALCQTRYREYMRGYMRKRRHKEATACES